MPFDPMIHWSQPSTYGILMNEADDAWHSGHVTDVLEFEDTEAFAVATQSGGVWMVADNGTQLQLSDSWNDPDSMCLALGPDGPRHLFAGCTRQYDQAGVRSVPVIMETQVGAAVPMLSWQPVVGSLPANAGSVSSILVIAQRRLIVVACKVLFSGDMGGIFWASIPPSSLGPAPSPRPPYVWKRAIVDSEPDKGFYDMAVGSTVRDKPRQQLESFDEITIVGGGKSGGIYVGQWQNNDLKMAPATQLSGDIVVAALATAGACSVASCDQSPNIMYAACAQTDGPLMQVVRSEDGGRTWRMGGSSIQGSDLMGSLIIEAGKQGNDWNNCIAVAPYDRNLVVLGWQGGPFLSLDGCANWQTIAPSPHMHSDTHALLFSAKTPSGNRTLYVGSDGGIASVDLDAMLRGDPAAFRSNYNRQLPTLQCYSALIRQFYGTIDGSADQPGLVSLGLQDNANVVARLGPAPTPWLTLDDGDGGWTGFLSNGALGHHTNGKALRVARFNDPAQLVLDVDVNVTTPPAPGLAGPVAETVVRPTYRNAAGQLLAAMTAVGGAVYGLYIDESADPQYGWTLLATLPAGADVGGLGSFGGGTIFAGTSGDGRVFAIDTEQGSVRELLVALPKPTSSTQMTGGSFIKFVAFSQSDVFALLVGTSEAGVAAGVTPASRSYVMRLSTLRWTPTLSMGLPGELMYGIAAVPAPDNGVNRMLVVSTDDAVYVSHDDGNSWANGSSGLPRRAHCGDLRCVADTRGGITLYLGTFGRSLWVAPLRARL